MKISVAMTTYNGELYLREQLESILSQSLQPDEIIICDDRSTDSTLSILEEYKFHKHIRVIINEQQLGVILNFKKAVSLTVSSNYVALSDQDDIWLPEKLATLAVLMSNLDQGLPCLVHSDLILVDEDNKVLNPSFKAEQGQGSYEENLETLLFRNFITGCTTLINPLLKQYFRDIPSTVRYHDEWLALLAFTFGNVMATDKATVRYRKHGRNVSIQAGTKPRNRFKSLLTQVMNSVLGKDDFIADQFVTAKAFYNQYKNSMDSVKQSYFVRFLKLEHKSYLAKKIAFGRMTRRFKIKSGVRL